MATAVAARFLKGLGKQVREINGEASTFDEGTVHLLLREPTDSEVAVVARFVSGRAKLPSAAGHEHLMSLTFSLKSLFSAPVIRMLTPHPIFATNSTICMDAVSHYHPESWRQTTSLRGLILTISQYVFVTDARRMRSLWKDLKGGIGVHPELGPLLSADATRMYNATHNADILGLISPADATDASAGASAAEASTAGAAADASAAAVAEAASASGSPQRGVPCESRGGDAQQESSAPAVTKEHAQTADVPAAAAGTTPPKARRGALTRAH